MSGTVAITPDRPQDLALDVTLDARAITAPDKLTLSRLRGEKFFWVEKYPTVRFKGEKLKLNGARKGTVDGKLTARGVTRPVTLAVSFDKDPATLKPGQAITISGSTKIDRRDFGMTSYSLIVGKTVAISLKALMIPR
jgi:polyisoprenoid-binding protein YceI